MTGLELRWIRTWENGADYIESIGGMDWHDGEPPYPWHHCEPQTRGWIGLRYIERCCCGALRDRARGPWHDRNSTRRNRKRERREAKMPREQVICQRCSQQYEAIAGSGIARARLCNRCWCEDLIREHAS